MSTPCTLTAYSQEDEEEEEEAAAAAANVFFGGFFPSQQPGAVNGWRRSVLLYAENPNLEKKKNPFQQSVMMTTPPQPAPPNLPLCPLTIKEEGITVQFYCFAYLDVERLDERSF